MTDATTNTPFHWLNNNSQVARDFSVMTWAILPFWDKSLAWETWKHFSFRNGGEMFGSESSRFAEVFDEVVGSNMARPLSTAIADAFQHSPNCNPTLDDLVQAHCRMNKTYQNRNQDPITFMPDSDHLDFLTDQTLIYRQAIASAVRAAVQRVAITHESVIGGLFVVAGTSVARQIDGHRYFMESDLSLIQNAKKRIRRQLLHEGLWNSICVPHLTALATPQATAQLVELFVISDKYS